VRPRVQAFARIGDFGTRETQAGTIENPRHSYCAE